MSKTSRKAAKQHDFLVFNVWFKSINPDIEGPSTWRKQYFWPLHARGACCRPQAPGAQNLHVWILFSRSLYSMAGQLSNLGYVISSQPACANSKILRIWRKAQIVTIPKLEKPLRGRKRYQAIYPYHVSPPRTFRDSSMLVSNQSLTHCCHRNKWAFNTGWP